MKKRFVIDVVKTLRYRAEVTATSEKAAQRIAEDLAGEQRGGLMTVNSHIAAQWPEAEGPELITLKENDYMVRRGWWWEASCYGSRLGPRTLAVPNIGQPAETARVGLEKLIAVNGERVGHVTLAFGYSGTHESLTTWGKVVKTEAEAYKGVRKFIEFDRRRARDKQRFDREIEEAITAEARQRNILVKMSQAPEKSLVRTPGGLWMTSTDADSAMTFGVEGEVIALKKDIDGLLDGKLVEITQAHISGAPQRVTMSAKAQHEIATLVLAQALAHSPRVS